MRTGKPGVTPVTVKTEKPVDIKPPAAPAVSTRDETVKKAVEKLVSTVSELKDVAGTGTESNGKGDPRIPARRAAVSALLATTGPTKDEVKAALEALGDKVKADIKWVEAAERSEPQATDASFEWAKNDMNSGQYGRDALTKTFATRLTVGKTRADGMNAGTTKFYDASDNNVSGLGQVTDTARRAGAMADVVLQFRGRTDKSGAEAARVDTVGPSMVAEQRVLLQSLTLDGTGDESQVREFALARELIASHPLSSGNAIFEARNAVGKFYNSEPYEYYKTPKSVLQWLKDEVPPGASASPYKSIHHNFSRDTPKNIEAFISEWMFPKGPAAQRAPLFVDLVDAMKHAREGDVAGARAAVTQLISRNPEALKGLGDTLAAAADDKVGEALVEFLKGACTKNLGTKDVAGNLEMAALMYTSLCQNNIGPKWLERNMLKAGDAVGEVADVLAQMKAGNSVGTLKELGEARIALRDATFAAKTGFERHQLMKFDADLNRLTCEELGAAVDRVGNVETDAQKTEAMVAVHTALQSAVAAGLGAIKDENDPAAKKGQSLEAVMKSISDAMAKGSVSPDRYRELMSEAYVATARTVQNVRSYFDSRVPALSDGGMQLDPMFADQLMKQTPLHYATALAEKGMRAGLVEEVSSRHIANVTGMRVLNSVGPVVFHDVVVVEDAADLVKLKVPRDALTVIYKSDEKKMKMAGGLVVDTHDAPGGNSHLNMYAMNNGIPVIALPELRTKYIDLLKNAEKEGGLYIDDRNGQFKMMTVGYAKEQGLVTDADLPGLVPGTNRNVNFLKPNAAEDGWELLARHELHISDTRPTRDVELFVPQDEVKGVGKKSVSFTELAQLGTFGRHLAGEKGIVLALLKGNPELSKYVPDGSVVTTGRVRGLLRDAGINDAWEKVWNEDPKVGIVDDKNFLQSAFYTDGAYRNEQREALSKLTHEGLTKHLIVTNADGTKALTPAGQALYDELQANPALAASDNWIARSTFTGEDRPGKSGAGQYESFPNLKDAVSRIEGIIGVIGSAWDGAPIENNVAEEINLRHIMASCVVQHCLKPDISGVMVSRNLDTGSRGQVNYQLVKGFGGGVEGGKAEEGVISMGSVNVKMQYPDEPNGLASKAALAELREVVLKVEKFFNDVVEPGKGHAVDMEVARVNDQWQVVQARVILMDK
ncbi:MAG: hypothetical protein JNK82_08770 [Myxococcaceae bacterium]|nr:hypothetical protein [Myxococcaceae bacterium]